MNHTWSIAAVIAAVVVAATSAPTLAQDPVPVPAATAPSGLSSEIADDVVRRLNDLRTEIRSGDSEVPAGTSQARSLAVLDGDLTVGGVVEGDVTVVNGTLRFASGAEVTGDVLLVGGSIINIGGARVRGEIRSFVAPFRYRVEEGEYVHLHEGSAVAAADRTSGADFLITTGRSYNRVEGMPIAFGPRIETRSSNPLRLQALAVYRSESRFEFDANRMGYFVRADQFLGGRGEYRLGATLHSVIDPIEDWQITDLEAGLAAFLFHSDYRDYFDRTGWSVFGTWDPAGMPVTLGIEALWEKHEIVPAADPWSMFRNDGAWRPQPAVAQGRLGSVIGSLTYDSRGADWNPANGWLVRGRLEHGFHVDLDYPALEPVAGDLGPPPSPNPDPGRFLSGHVDIRSYNRIDADARLNVRLVAGGSLTGSTLPPQRQHALGGDGTLPGYSLFSVDCGARSSVVTFAGSAATPGAARLFANYGCDAFGLLQVEYRGKLSFRFRWDDGPWTENPRDGEGETRGLGWNMSPDWAIFVDAGRGWSYESARPDEPTRVSVGAGILLERIGLYMAVPVTSGSGVNLFLRLGPRF